MAGIVKRIRIPTISVVDCCLFQGLMLFVKCAHLYQKQRKISKWTVKKISINFSNGGGGRGKSADTPVSTARTMQSFNVRMQRAVKKCCLNNGQLLCYGTCINRAILRRVCDECVMAGTSIFATHCNYPKHTPIAGTYRHQ